MVHFLKGQDHRGQRSKGHQVQNQGQKVKFGPIFTKLGGRVEGDPGVPLRGSFFEKSRSPRSKVKFLCQGLYLRVPLSDLDETW